MGILAAVAVFIFAIAGAAALTRRAASPARGPQRARTRAAGRPAGRPRRKSLLVTAAKAAGVNISSDQLSHATAELAGKAAGRTARRARRISHASGRGLGRDMARGGRWAHRHAGRRWQARGDSGPLMLRRVRPGDGGQDPPQPGQPRPAGGGPGETGVTVPGGQATEHVPGRFEPGDPPWQITQVGKISRSPDGKIGLDGWKFADPHLPDGHPDLTVSIGGQPVDVLFGHPLTELHTRAHGHECACPVTAPPTPSAPATRSRARKEITTMRHRYSINLERPSTDAEFLESAVHLGDVLKALAEEVADWADSLSGLNLPQSVLSPLHQVSEGIEEAATGAASSAKAFEDEFEDARDVASRGMHFTGEDAA